MTEKTLVPPIQMTWPMVRSLVGGIIGTQVVILLALLGLGAQAFFHLDGKITGIYTELGEIKESVARLDERLTSHMEAGHE